jgi:hypothetical protein
MKPLNGNQRALLKDIAKSCETEGCQGACDHGWYEPVEGGVLRTARSLQDRGLVSLANGSHARWIAAHITMTGREQVAIKQRAATTKERA